MKGKKNGAWDVYNKSKIWTNPMHERNKKPTRKNGKRSYTKPKINPTQHTP